jgi:hypothetical protein
MKISLDKQNVVNSNDAYTLKQGPRLRYGGLLGRRTSDWGTFGRYPTRRPGCRKEPPRCCSRKTWRSEGRLDEGGAIDPKEALRNCKKSSQNTVESTTGIEKSLMEAGPAQTDNPGTNGNAGVSSAPANAALSALGTQSMPSVAFFK